MVYQNGDFMNNNNSKKSPICFYNEDNGKLQTQLSQLSYSEYHPYCDSNLNNNLIDNIKNTIDLQKHNHHLQQNLIYKEQLAEIKTKNDAEKQLIYPEIYKNKEDRLVYVICNPNGKWLVNKELLKQRGFESFICYSNYPQFQQLLCVSWNYNEHILCFDCKIKDTVFLHKLNSHGLHLLVSGKAQKEAASVLLEYFINNAKRCELPFDLGWWKDFCGNWHFAKKGNLTLKELIKKNGI